MSPFFGEFVGTLVLILFGNGVVAATLLKKSKAEGAGWMVITSGWALGIFCGVIAAVACGSPGANLNPAITVALAIANGDYSHILSLTTAQLLGAFCGASLVWLAYYPHWRATESEASKLAAFSTGPAIRKPVWNFLSEAIGTGALILIGSALRSRPYIQGGTALSASWSASMLVLGIGLSLGGATGYAINPARDLGPRLAHAVLPIAGKGSSDWSYAPIPVLSPLTSAALMALLLKHIGL